MSKKKEPVKLNARGFRQFLYDAIHEDVFVKRVYTDRQGLYVQMRDGAEFQIDIRPINETKA